MSEQGNWTRSPRQILSNTLWAGGTIPTGWTAGGGTGTRIAAVSGIDASDNSIQFQATAQRPFLQFPAFAVLAGDIFTFSFDVEAIGNVAALTWANLISFASGTATVDFNGVTTNGAALVSGLVVGQRVYVRVTWSTSGSPPLRLGPGCAANVTADITLSRPACYPGTHAGYNRRP